MDVDPFGSGRANTAVFARTYDDRKPPTSPFARPDPAARTNPPVAASPDPRRKQNRAVATSPDPSRKANRSVATASDPSRRANHCRFGAPNPSEVVAGVYDDSLGSHRVDASLRLPLESHDDPWDWQELESVLDELAGDVALASVPRGST